ncbi:hypothetical protein Pan44_50870 [Caulifigura coniformis]|uniref:Response regulatory domain-containing protein n=1 Tax=Caulifigura coniformis TaxID=2527983 RepID=A0A517SLM0_9PLAN|nr:hypothetical protein Pan44_50870 [Caulifigura coniformis]
MPHTPFIPSTPCLCASRRKVDASPPLHEISRHRAPDIDSRPKGVLLIERKLSFRRALGEALRGQGFDLWTAVDCAEGVDVYGRFWPLIEIILCDTQSTGVNEGAVAALRRVNPRARLCLMCNDRGSATQVALRHFGALRSFDQSIHSLREVTGSLWNLASHSDAVPTLPGPPATLNREDNAPPMRGVESRASSTRCYGWLRRVMFRVVAGISSVMKLATNLRSGFRERPSV